MRRYLNVLFLGFIIIPICAQTGNVTVGDVISRVNRQRIINYVTDLQNFGTRFMLTDKRFEAAEYLKNKFESMGFTDVKLDSFYCHTTIGRRYFQRDIDTTTLQVNVVATLPGIVNSDAEYIICGHYDSFCENADPFLTAPGADDNASGTTCVLEAASAIMSCGYLPKSTLKFICFAAEELAYFGDMGSRSYAHRAAERGDNIKLVINNDMIGFNAHRLTEAKVNVAPTNSFTRIEEVINICNTYGAIEYLGNGYAGADLMGFEEMGYDGIYFEENDFFIQAEQNYHKSTDITNNVDFIYMTEVVKAATAVLLSMEEVLSVNEETIIPSAYILKQNYPNPFNPTTTIEYTLPERGYVTIKIYNTIGETIAVLVNEEKTAGNHKIFFSAEKLSSGIYYYSMNSGNYSEIRKMVLLK